MAGAFLRGTGGFLLNFLKAQEGLNSASIQQRASNADAAVGSAKHRLAAAPRLDLL
jgi:hypothetical protein